MAKATHSDNKRGKILQAALDVIKTQGAANLTFDSLSKQSGVTKGGILYYFPNKEAILQGLLDEFIQEDEAKFQRQWEKMGKTPDTFLAAEIQCSLNENGENDHVASALLAAVVDNPKMLDGVQKIVGQRYEAVRNTKLGFEMSAIILMALDGYYMMQALQLQPLNAKDRKHIMKYMLKLAQGKEKP